MLLPREHGSWGILLFPFFSAVYLARPASWLTIAAFAAAMAAFLAREPLIILARQAWVWSERRPEAAEAGRTLTLVLPVLAAAGAWLWFGGADRRWLIGLGAVAAVLMAMSVYAALHRLQRSPTLQIAGSFGLTLSAALAWLAAGREPDRVLWLLIGVHTIHAVGGVLTVHARLEALQNRGKKRPQLRARSAGFGWQLVQTLAAAWLWAEGDSWLAAAVAAPAVVHSADLLKLDRPEILKTPLKRVGFRELFLSAAFSLVVVAAL